MPQVFHPSSNTIARASVVGVVVLLGGLLWITMVINRSGYVTRAGVAREQPIPFSHKHHVSQLGIDCRYCHTSVETSAFAGIPPTQTCMNCHAQIWSDSPMLEPVRESYRTGRSIRWIRVHDLPSFAYFNHSIHIHKGIGCSTCHGRVDQMNLTRQEASLQMEWCLNCHRNPQKYIRPRDQIFNMAWEPPANQEELGRHLIQQYNVKTRTDCDTCHR